MIFVGGIMLTVSFKELLPQALIQQPSRLPGILGIVLGAVFMFLSLHYLGEG
eukprot:m.445882 g.445882  ORF g.445882 m.445882 type:complete len:52 (+) comp56860_c0_seq1:1886-2041(+)